MVDTTRTITRRCPWCGVTIAWVHEGRNLASRGQVTWRAHAGECPSCDEPIIALEQLEERATGRAGHVTLQRWDVLPRLATARPIASEIPDDIADLMREAELCLPISPRGAGALARRALQQVLRREFDTSGNLFDEIETTASSNRIPPDLAADLHAIRHVGNFAAHPTDSSDADEIVDVDAEDVEVALELLRELLDVVYVQPADRARSRGRINRRLSAAGKQPLAGESIDPDEPPAAAPNRSAYPTPPPPPLNPPLPGAPQPARPSSRQ